MGITFGNEAKVQVEGDMVGGDQVKVAISEDAWQAVAATIAEEPGVDLASKGCATMALSSIREETKKETPDPNRIEGFANTIRRLAPGAFKVLLAAVPELVKLVPHLL